MKLQSLCSQSGNLKSLSTRNTLQPFIRSQNLVKAGPTQILQAQQARNIAASAL